MRRHIIAALAAGGVLGVAAPAIAYEPPIAGPPITVVFDLAPDPNVVRVRTDNDTDHYRLWPVESLLPISREDRCRFRVDARRVLLGRPLTQGVPRRCMSRWARKLRPDPAPSAGR